PGQVNKGKGLANTGASVIWLVLVAVLLAAVGGFITYRGRANKNN
ncbi:LPXTG cell wall anchor domain-containing protein, partial [Corynebacterium kutscheri]